MPVTKYLSGIAGRQAFAIAPDRPATAYELTADKLGKALELRRDGRVSTGPTPRPWPRARRRRTFRSSRRRPAATW